MPRSTIARVALAGMLAFIHPSGAWADESKRDSLKGEIKRLLQDMASELRDVPGDSSTSDLERTMGYAGNVYDKARELKDHLHGDSEADRMANYYPDIARRYQDAARYLREEKNDYRKLDEYPRKCEDAMRELANRMRAYTDSHDPRGVEEVPKLAREFGRIGKEAMDQAEGTKRMIYERYDRVDDFSDSEGPWGDVKSNLHGAGRTMYEHTNRVYEQIRRDDVCGNLSKEERNPLVEQAMAKLFEGKKGIELLYTSIDGQLGEMASAIDGLVGDSSDSDINTAEQKLGEVERMLEQLDRIKGNDGEARRRVETYRNIARAGREGLKHLRILKQGQALADKAPEKCNDSKNRLMELIRQYTDEREKESAKNLRLRAKGIGAPIAEGLKKTEEHHSVMERAYSDTLRFDPSDGRWREVTEKHKAQANAIFEHWKKAKEAAKTACGDLARGDEHPEVKKALEDLEKDRSNSETELLKLEADYRNWEAGVMELRQWYKTDTAAVRDMFCKIPESPGDSAEGDAYAAKLAEVADRMRDRIRPKWSTIADHAQAMVATADMLHRRKEREVSADARKLKETIEKKMNSIRNILNDEMNGSNDPHVRAKMETGKNEHKRIQGDSSKCTEDEVTVGRRRIDCIRVSGTTCFVVEIKPNNPGAQDRGREQLRTGMEAVKNAVEGKKMDDLTGDLAVFKACYDEKSGKVSLDSELRVYEYCPADGELFKDFIVP